MSNCISIPETEKKGLTGFQVASDGLHEAHLVFCARLENRPAKLSSKELEALEAINEHLIKATRTLNNHFKNPKAAEQMEPQPPLEDHPI